MSFKLPDYRDLNETQRMIINTLGDQSRVAVIGGPGTGKTIIGLQAVGMMSGDDSLFLTYSIPLIKSIRCAAKKHKLPISNVEFNTYHKWLWKLLIELQEGMDPNYPGSTGQKRVMLEQEYQNFISSQLQKKPYEYNINKLEAFLSSVREDVKNPDFPDKRYEHIFIDEAQDIQDHLIRIFMQFTNNILITYDDSQKIGNEDNNDSLSYDHSNVLIDLGIGDRFFDLIENYRNTKQVEAVAKELMVPYDVNEISLSKTTSKREGERPTLIHVKDKGNNPYERLVNYICQRYDRSKSVCVVFGNDNIDIGKALFDNLKEKFTKSQKQYGFELLFKFGHKNNDNISDNNALNNSIFLMTYKSCKGLEFDEVYVIADNAAIDNYQQRNSFFVAFTRSKDNTHVVVFDQKEDALTKKLLENRFLFNNVNLEDNPS